MYWFAWMTSRPKPKTKINLSLDLEFNSIHRNQQTFKIVDTQKCLGLKISGLIENFLIFFLHFLDSQTYGC